MDGRPPSRFGCSVWGWPAASARDSLIRWTWEQWVGGEPRVGGAESDRAWPPRSGTGREVVGGLVIGGGEEGGVGTAVQQPVGCVLLVSRGAEVEFVGGRLLARGREGSAAEV